jgi:hypothetical protein
VRLQPERITPCTAPLDRNGAQHHVYHWQAETIDSTALALMMNIKS